jgi:hypothetical protein
MAFSIKQKPEKIKYLTNISTLDEIHRKYVADFESKKLSLPTKKERVKVLTIELSTLNKNDVRRMAEIKEQLARLNEDISDIDSGITELDYYSRTNDILIEYYNQLDDGEDEIHDAQSEDTDTTNNSEQTGTEVTNDKIPENSETNIELSNNISNKLIELNLLSQKRRKPKKPTRKRARHTEQKKNRNILSFFTSNQDECNDEDDDDTETETETDIMSESANNINNNISTIINTNKINNLETIVSNRATLLDEYMMLLDRSYSTKPKINLIRTCQNQECNGAEKTLIQSEGLYVCKTCGEVEHIIIESEVPNHKDSVNEKPRYPYKRLNHLIEWLNQFQAKESTEIPDNVYNDIITELKHQKQFNIVMNMKYPDAKKLVKKILKKLKLQLYYEHIPYIISKITHKPPPTLSRYVEEKIKTMFKQVQEPFSKYCPTNRINFLNYFKCQILLNVFLY